MFFELSNAKFLSNHNLDVVISRVYFWALTVVLLEIIDNILLELLIHHVENMLSLVKIIYVFLKLSSFS